MVSNAALNSSGKRFLSNWKGLPSVLEVLLQVQGRNVKCSHKKQIARP